MAVRPWLAPKRLVLLGHVPNNHSLFGLRYKVAESGLLNRRSFPELNAPARD